MVVGEPTALIVMMSAFATFAPTKIRPAANIDSANLCFKSFPPNKNYLNTYTTGF